MTIPNNVPLGAELDWSEEEMDALLDITVSDLVLAQQLVAESVSPVFQDILFAEDEEINLNGTP